MTKPQPISSGTLLKFGENTFTFGQEVVELQDSSALRDDFDALRARMAGDGYLFMRGFHPEVVARQAAHKVLEVIAERGALAPNTNIDDGIASEENKNIAFFRDLEVSHAPEVLAMVDGAHTFGFFENFLDGPVLTFDKRWLRAMARGGSNFFHYDSAYVGRGTFKRYTMWSALTDISLENGPLVICLGSHQDERLRQTYGQIDMDRDLIDPVFSKDAAELVKDFGFTLATAHFQPGDAIIFGLHMMHSSIPNLTNRYRISIDTRYQLAVDEKDERFFGENGAWQGNFYNKDAMYKPMAEMRREWGLE